MKNRSLAMIVLAAGLIVMPALAAAGEGTVATNTSPTNAPAATADVAKAAFQRAMETFEPAMNAQDAGKEIDFAALREVMQKFWAEFPDSHRSATLLTYYMDMFAKSHPGQVQAEWMSFTNCASPVAAILAGGKAQFAALSREPFKMAFVALDGRAVNLEKMRGKVVLIDFWATWCVPCVEQIPALKRLYAQYHGQGFEIIGISLDRPEDRLKLDEFISREGLAWPQCFDGEMWQNESAVRYAVNTAPFTFLLDTNGMLAGMNLEEAKLEGEVKRLLGPQTSAP